MKFDHEHRYRWQQRDRTVTLLAWATILSVVGLALVLYLVARG